MFTDANVPSYKFSMADGAPIVKEENWVIEGEVHYDAEQDCYKVTETYEYKPGVTKFRTRILTLEQIQGLGKVDKSPVKEDSMVMTYKVGGLNEYMDMALKTAIYPKGQALEYLVLGLTSEAGEVAGKLKKVIRDNYGEVTDEKKDELIAETGDVLWYVANIASVLGVTLEEMASRNVNKLMARKDKGTLQGSGDNR